MKPNLSLNTQPELVYLPGFQWEVGPLTEFDPHALLREINDDVSKAIGQALDFANTGSIGELTQPLQNSFMYVGTTLSSFGKDLELDEAKVYTRALQKAALCYLDGLSNTSMWVSHHPNFLAAAYSKDSPGDLETMVRYDIRRPQLEGYDVTPALVREVTPTLLYVTKQLLGAAVEAE